MHYKPAPTLIKGSRSEVTLPIVLYQVNVIASSVSPESLVSRVLTNTENMVKMQLCTNNSLVRCQL